LSSVKLTSTSRAADSIINPEAPLALRLSGQLLLGVVKVHSKKVGYLFQDCNDALIKIKQVQGPSPELCSLPLPYCTDQTFLCMTFECCCHHHA
jgi:hypothetical protein